MTTPATCAGCVYVRRRLKYSKPRRYCKRYHQIRDERFIDYIPKPTAIQAALNYLRIGSLK
jgi:hypothetical protein